MVYKTLVIVKMDIKIIKDKLEILKYDVEFLAERLDKLVDEINKAVNESSKVIFEQIRITKQELDEILKNISRMEAEEENKVFEKATENQIRYLKILYNKLGMTPPPDLEQISKAEAKQRIDELKRKLGW